MAKTVLLYRCSNWTLKKKQQRLTDFQGCFFFLREVKDCILLDDFRKWLMRKARNKEYHGCHGNISEIIETTCRENAHCTNSQSGIAV